MGPLSLLLLDDDPHFHVLVKKLLANYKKRECQLQIAVDISTARKLSKQFSFHIVFLDLDLRGSREAGFNFLEELREQGSKAEVLVMSSSGTFESAQKALRFEIGR